VPANGPEAAAQAAGPAPLQASVGPLEAVVTVDGGTVFYNAHTTADANALRALCKGTAITTDDLSRAFDHTWSAPAAFLKGCKKAGDDVAAVVIVESAMPDMRSPKERPRTANKNTDTKHTISKMLLQRKRGRSDSVATKDLVKALRGHPLLTGDARAECVEACLGRLHRRDAPEVDAPKVEVRHDADTGAYPPGAPLVIAIGSVRPNQRGDGDLRLSLAVAPPGVRLINITKMWIDGNTNKVKVEACDACVHRQAIVAALLGDAVTLADWPALSLPFDFCKSDRTK